MSSMRNNEGFSLVEVLIALAIITISSIALMKVSAFVIKNNIINEVRNKAVETLRNNINSIMAAADFDNISSKSDNCSLKVRNFYVSDCKIIDNVSLAAGLPNTKKIKGTIIWGLMNQKFTYTITTFLNK